MIHPVSIVFDWARTQVVDCIIPSITEIWQALNFSFIYRISRFIGESNIWRIGR